MNFKKLVAILLGITALCSFADAASTININGAQTVKQTVKSPSITVSSQSGAGADLTVTSETITSAPGSQIGIAISIPNEKITSNTNNQGSYTASVSP